MAKKKPDLSASFYCIINFWYFPFVFVIVMYLRLTWQRLQMKNNIRLILISFFAENKHLDSDLSVSGFRCFKEGGSSSAQRASVQLNINR